MKNLIKKFPVYLTIFICLVSMVVTAVPGFAADVDDLVVWDSTASLTSPNYYDKAGELVDTATYDGTIFYCASSVSEFLQPGEYYVTGVSLASSNGTFPSPFAEVGLVLIDGEKVQQFNYSFGEHFIVPDGMVGAVVAQSWSEVSALYCVVPDEPAADGLYYSAYDILQEAFYGSDVDLTAAQDMTLTIMATLAALFVVALPFILLWFIISMCGRWR